ncbi:MAG: spiro-SPASM protein [Spirochaetota bacterium]
MIVCLYNDAPETYLATPIGERTTIERVKTYVDRVEDLAGTDAETGAGSEVVVYTTRELDGLPHGWRVRTGPPLTQRSLVALLGEYTRGPDTELLVSYLDRPFLNAELTERMLRRHRDYRAEYTFADGYPRGLAPEILSGRAVSHLEQLADESTRIDREGVFAIVQKDINRLDVETELSRVDQRLLRLELNVSTRANLALCRRLAAGAPEAIDDWAAHVESRHVEHRTLPRFVSVQVLEQEVQRLAYSPYPAMREDVLAPGRVMSAETFSDLVRRIDAFAPEAIVHVSLWGEASLHPEIESIVDLVLGTESLTLLVETSGIGWKLATREKLFATETERLIVIVGMDSNDRSVYESVRGDGFEEAQRFAREAVARMGSRAYVQAVRSELTEPALEAFYREWKQQTERIIVEKYDHFCGALPERKIGDISPLDRFPCWHLERDLYVLVDGTVPLCREDIGAKENLGNVFTDGIDAVWEAGRSRFGEHVNGKFGGICETCDEYYTFNF